MRAQSPGIAGGGGADATAAAARCCETEIDRHRTSAVAASGAALLAVSA